MSDLTVQIPVPLQLAMPVLQGRFVPPGGEPTSDEERDTVRFLGELHALAQHLIQHVHLVNDIFEDARWVPLDFAIHPLRRAKTRRVFTARVPKGSDIQGIPEPSEEQGPWIMTITLGNEERGSDNCFAFYARPFENGGTNLHHVMYPFLTMLGRYMSNHLIHPGEDLDPLIPSEFD